MGCFICGMHSLFLYMDRNCVRKILFCKNFEPLLSVCVCVYVYTNACNVRVCVACSVWVCLSVCTFIYLFVLHYI